MSKSSILTFFAFSRKKTHTRQNGTMWHKKIKIIFFKSFTGERSARSKLAFFPWTEKKNSLSGKVGENFRNLLPTFQHSREIEDKLSSEAGC
jgi:hypothetical protein